MEYRKTVKGCLLKQLRNAAGRLTIQISSACAQGTQWAASLKDTTRVDGCRAWLAARWDLRAHGDVVSGGGNDSVGPRFLEERS
jgi:hypothetical protein